MSYSPFHPLISFCSHLNLIPSYRLLFILISLNVHIILSGVNLISYLSHFRVIYIYIYIYIYNLIFHFRLNFTLSDPKFIACQIISAFTFAGPSFHLIATSSSSQPHIVFISNFNFISFSPRPYCLTLQPSFRSFRFVTILQPIIFNGSCSYLAQLLASVEKCTVLTMHGSLCTFSGILWLFEMVRIHTGRSLSPDSLPLYSQYHRMDPLHIWYSCWAGAWSLFMMGFLCWFFLYNPMVFGNSCNFWCHQGRLTCYLDSPQFSVLWAVFWCHVNVIYISWRFCLMSSTLI